MSDADIDKVLEAEGYYYDVLGHGNLRVLLNIFKKIAELGKEDKLLVGTNVPSKSAYSPLGCWITIAALSNQFQDVHPGTFIAMATGNVADCYGLNHGRIKEGYALDLIVLDGFGMDSCPFKTLQSGNMCSTSFVMIDGELRMPGCKNVPGPSRRPEFTYK